MRAQLWLWFVGMIVTTFPWHYVGILGMPRRMAYYDYSDPALANEAMPVVLSAVGGFILVLSAVLFFAVLIRGHRSTAAEPGIYRFSVAVHPPARVPVALNSHGMWVALMIGLTVTNYGFPILQLAFRQDTSVPAVYVGVQK
jgi:cytochrome c oxidase subunit 1